MLQRVFIRVVGFSDAERHALNTVFRLSRDEKAGRSISYEPWLPDAPEPARLVLIDGSAGSASEELAGLRHNPDAALIWVGAVSPAHAWRTFTRPLNWPEVLRAMDAYFKPAASLAEFVDFDLGGDTLIPAIENTGPVSLSDQLARPKRALVADQDPEARLYMCSKLAMMDITLIDVATTVMQAKMLLGKRHYDFVCIDMNLQDEDAWMAVSAAKWRLRTVLITGEHISVTTRLTAKISGCKVMQKPLHPGELTDLLLKV